MVGPSLPYRIGVLCYLYDDAGRVLLLRRARHPNRHLYSPVGGKLDVEQGESPTGCALREIEEETGLRLATGDLRLAGIISETAFEGEAHWLMFLFEANGPVQVETGTIDEGTLDWHDPATINDLDIPETDRVVLWPLMRRFTHCFFAAHIDCRGQAMQWRLEQPSDEAGE